MYAAADPLVAEHRGRIVKTTGDGRISERGQRLRDLCEAAGFEGVLSPDIMVPVWEKFVMLVPLGGLHALTRLPLGKWRGDPDLLALCEASLHETVAVGLAEGVRLPLDITEKALAMMRSMPPHHTHLDGQ
jgi:ketopantoate reductase